VRGTSRSGLQLQVSFPADALKLHDEQHISNDHYALIPFAVVC
jgi:hypothetical protein